MPKELGSILDLANSNLFSLLYRIREFIVTRIARIQTIQNTELWWTPTWSYQLYRLPVRYIKNFSTHFAFEIIAFDILRTL